MGSIVDLVSSVILKNRMYSSVFVYLAKLAPAICICTIKTHFCQKILNYLYIRHSPGSISPNSIICPTGHYCLEGSGEPEPCDEGNYQPNQGASSSSECLSCEAGEICTTTGLTLPNGNCSAGFYCQGNRNAKSIQS